MRKIFSYIFISLCVFLFSSNSVFASDEGMMAKGMKGKVQSISHESDTIFLYDVKIVNGKFNGEIVTVEQDKEFGLWNDDYSVGDKVVVFSQDFEGETFFSIRGFWYFDMVLFWIGVLILLIILLAKKDGVMSIISLSIAFLFIFGVFVKGITFGFSPILSAIFIAIIISVVSIILLSGFSHKSFASIVGTVGGVFLAVVLSFIIMKTMNITGMGDDNSVVLFSNFPEMNMKGIFLGGTILGALGAIMDTAISISAGMKEVLEHKPNIHRKQLFYSGMNIGMDIVGSMLHTLIFAYVGSSLTLILLFSMFSPSIIDVINTPFIAEEIIRAIVGSIGLLFAIPLTVFVNAKMYRKGKE